MRDVFNTLYLNIYNFFRVNCGPHEDVAKFQLMEVKYTSDIKPEVAQFLKFTYTECRAIVDMFYEEEEKEVEQIKRK